jgi:hypothetical protein
MGALMTNTDLTYDDLAEATTWMADRLLASQNENRSLSQKLAAVYGEVAALRCALEFEQECSRELRNRGDHWQVVANEAPPRLGYLPSVIAASPLNLLGKLRRAVLKRVDDLPQRVGGSSSRSVVSGW